MSHTKLGKFRILIAALAMTVASQYVTSPGSGAEAATNKQFTVGLSQEFEILNPVVSQMFASSMLYYAVGHPLVSITPDWKWKCWLCTDLPTLENKKARVVTEGGAKKVVVDWELRANAKWGDGKPITGHDVVLGWKVGKSPKVAVGEKDIYERIEKIVVDKDNPKKFQMVYKKARYDYYQLGTFYLLPSHLEGPIWEKTKDKEGVYEKQTLYNTDPTNPGLYSGPYVVKELKLGSHLVATRNPHYYGQKAHIDRVIFKYIPDTATLESNLLSGSIDMISELGIKFDQAVQIEKRFKSNPRLANRFEVRFRQGMVYEHIDLNLRNPILTDINVRKALVYAIDRQRLSSALFQGKQKPAIHNIHPLDVYFTENVVKYPHAPKKSEELLEKAGWKAGSDGIRRKGGKKLSLTLMTTAGDKSRERVQVFLQQQWKKVGIEVKIKNEPARVYFGETVRKAKYSGMAMYAWVSSPDNPPRSTLHSKEIPTKENGYSGQNSAGWRNDLADKNLVAIETEFDIEKRKQMMQKVLHAYTDEVPVIPLYYRADIVVVPKNLKGHRMTGHQFMSTLSIDKWDLGSNVQGE